MSKRLFIANASPAGYASASALYAGQPISTPPVGRILRGGFSKPAALTQGRPVFGSLNFVRSMGQGACAGLLMLIGVMHITATLPTGEQSFAGLFAGLTGSFGSLLTTPSFDQTGSLEAGLSGAIENIMAGGAPGILEIMGAIALFLNAGRGMAKIIGLLGFVAIVAAHANGVTHAELLDRLTGLVEQAQGLALMFA